MRILKSLFLGAAVLAMAGCGDNAHLPKSASYGPNPALPAPQDALIPFYNVPSVTGWKDNGAPTPAPGLTVKAFATQLEHPRWLLVLPNGDVLVAEGDHGTEWGDKMGYGGYVETLYRRIQG